ncbi:MAG: glucosaminidase domain-containing protein, partial [Selenomonadaceae bacterium]|nr:glucosaminidase domain-containing protein [Selenomonadaceae bacterium]
MKKYALAALAAVALACSPLVISSASAAAAASTAQAAAVKAAASNTTVADGSTAITPAETRAAVPPRGQITRPDFPATPPGTFNQQAVSGVHWQLCPAFTTPLLPAPAAADNITIAGPATATQEQMVRFIRKRNPQPKLTCSLEEIVGYYYEEAGREGVRPDVALCQALKETGFFNYGGDVAPAQNNFCGLGATGNHEPGARFATAQLGVRAHIQHLLAYSRMEQPSLTVNDPRYWLVVQNHPEIH